MTDFEERISMDQMMYVRFLSEGNVGHDLANPFETAYLICPECKSSMILDRKTWTTECLGCSMVELDIPAMFVNRTGVSRDVACISFELCVPSVINRFRAKPSKVFIRENYHPEGSKEIAGEIKCTMKRVKICHDFLMRRPLFVEALLIRYGITVNDIVDGLIGAYVDKGIGFFLFPKIRLRTLVEEIDIISMLNPSISYVRVRGCNDLR